MKLKYSNKYTTNRSSNGREPFQFHMFENDSTPDLQNNLCDKYIVQFLCELYKGNDYKQLTLLALLLLSITPTSVTYEEMALVIWTM